MEFSFPKKGLGWEGNRFVTHGFIKSILPQIHSTSLVPGSIASLLIASIDNRKHIFLVFDLGTPGLVIEIGPIMMSATAIDGNIATITCVVVAVALTVIAGGAAFNSKFVNLYLKKPSLLVC